MSDILKLKSFSSILSSSSGGAYGSRSNGYSPQMSNIKKGSYSTRTYKTVNTSNSYDIIGGSLDKYLNRIDEIKDFIESDLTKTVIDILKDTINDLMLVTDEMAVIEDKVVSKRINQILNDLNIQSHIKSDMVDIIYYGNYSYSLKYDKKTKTYDIEYLYNPSKTITVYKDNRIQKYLLIGNEGGIYEVSDDEVFSISTNDYKLELSDSNLLGVSESQVSEDDDDKKEITIRSYKERYLGGTPLYNNISFKIKEFILKEYLISILSIKDLIQPIILLVSMEKSTKAEDAIDLALEVENLINQNVDLSFIESQGLGIKELVATLIDNIRVLPDYDSKLGSMNELNLDKITEKIEKIRDDQQTNKENIVTTLGIPTDLFQGTSSRWEAIKTSQRFNSKLNYYSDALNKSIYNLVYSIMVKEYGRAKADKYITSVTINLVNKSILKDNSQSTQVESMKNQMADIGDLLDLYDRLVASDQIDKDKLGIYFNTAFNKIDPNLKTILKDNLNK